MTVCDDQVPRCRANIGNDHAVGNRGMTYSDERVKYGEPIETRNDSNEMSTMTIDETVKVE